MRPKTQAMKEKIDKLTSSKFKDLGTSKDTVKGVKRPPAEWERHLLIPASVRHG